MSNYFHMACARLRPIAPPLPIPPDTSGVHVWLILTKADGALARNADQSIVDVGFCLSDFGTLEILLHKGPKSVSEIAHRIGLTAGSMSVALDRLEKRGLVRRHAHPTDRRNRVIRLTAAGKTLIEKPFREHPFANGGGGKALTNEEPGTLIELLKRLGKGAEELLRSPQSSRR